MERILKEYKSNKCDDCLDNYQEISLITYLAGLNEEEIITTEIETASNLLHCAFKSLNKNYSDIETILNENTYIFVKAKSIGHPFKIFIRDKWLFRLILIHSIKHSDILECSVQQGNDNFIKTVIEHIVKAVVIVKPLSLHLLRTLLLIVTKCKSILSTNISRMVLLHMNKVAMSPITIFRQYARGISKAVVLTLPKNEILFSDISLLPVKSIDMCDVVHNFSRTFIIENQVRIIRKVLDMFHQNVESKDGGALYECILFYSFEEWKIQIWPFLLDDLKCIDYEGEFFQSLLKYWITLNVCTYKSDFYYFLREEPIDLKVKAHVLLESKKKGCDVNEEIVKKDTLVIFNNVETRDLGLKIASTYHKKSLWLNEYEIDIMMSYLYSNTNVSLEEEGRRSFCFFFSQIFLHAHNELKKREDNLHCYITVIEKLYKYCTASLRTSFFDVGVEIALLLLTIAAGNDKDLRLNYKLEKRDCYLLGENLLYRKLKENGVWWFRSKAFQQDITDCFVRNNGSSSIVPKLLSKHLNITDFLNKTDIKTVVNTDLQANLDSETRVKNYSEIIYQNNYCSDDNLKFLEEVTDFIISFNIPLDESLEGVIFKVVLYLDIIMVATRYNRYDTRTLQIVVQKCLLIVENLIFRNSEQSQRSYKNTKTMEAFINSVMVCITENIDALWTIIDKQSVINHLILIIQRSNMKRPLSLSVEVLKRFGHKMEENENDRNYKIQFLNNTLNAIYENSNKSDLKIRRHPEIRLVVHAMCCSDRNPNKPLLKWVLAYLLEVTSDAEAPDSTIASALHTIEILISDNNLQNPTLPFVSDIIIQCVELFAKPSWIIRNANLQLTRAVIDRFYGVCLNISDRPKCVEDLLLLFPILSSYFHKILSLDVLDERAVLVFQFFSESQLKRNICTGLTEDSMGQFRQLFMVILQKYPNHYGKMAALSYSAVCNVKEIPKEICSVIHYFKNNFKYLRKNIFANFISLIQHLYEKYRSSFQHAIGDKEINVINFAIKDLLNQLRDECNDGMFNSILLKVKSSSVVLKEFKSNVNGDNFKNRLWQHNKIPFLLINSKPEEISGVLNVVLTKGLLSCVQVKILTILVSKFENGGFSGKVLQDILEVLFEKSIVTDDTDCYLLNCYYKTILALYRNSNSVNYRNSLLQFKATSNFYKVLIYVLYYSERIEQLSMTDQNQFYNLVEKQYMSFPTLNEDMRNDIIATLPYLQATAPETFKLMVFKLIFYSSLFTSTYLEAYKCISFISRRNYSSIFGAVKDFFSTQNLNRHFKNQELIVIFFKDIVEYIPDHHQEMASDRYYAEESDILVPKLFLERWIYSEIEKIRLKKASCGNCV